MVRFAVTYDVITPESAENGDYEESGFIDEACSLREAFDLCGRFFTQDSGSWFTNDEYGHGTRAYYEQGREEVRSLHPPRSITPASYERLRRLFSLARK
jgi:hypothetical protein